MPEGIKIEIDVKGALAELQKDFAHLSPAEIARGTARAINRTLGTGRTKIVDKVTNAYYVKSAAVRKAFGVSKATPGNLSGSLYASGSPIALINFKRSQTKRGVNVTIKRSSGTKLIPSAFLAVMSSGHKGVFAKGHAENGTFKFRNKRIRKTGNDLDIGEIKGVSVPTMFNEEKRLQRFEVQLNQDFVKRLRHELDYLSKRKQ